MKTSSRWKGLGALGSAAAIVVVAAALTPGAQAASGYTGCANKTVKITLEDGSKFPVKAKAISVSGVTCAAAYEFIAFAYRGEKISKTGFPLNYKCKPAEFKTPVGFLPTLCTKPGKKIKYGQQGG
jgi:hypothetical protein